MAPIKLHIGTKFDLRHTSKIFKFLEREREKEKGREEKKSSNFMPGKCLPKLLHLSTPSNSVMKQKLTPARHRTGFC